MINFAQTNIQLLNQLHREGYSADDLHLVRVAYRFAMDLFSGQFRASGKTFIAHLVGTASVLGSLRVVDGLAARLRGAAGVQPSPEKAVPSSPRPAVGSQ